VDLLHLGDRPRLDTPRAGGLSSVPSGVVIQACRDPPRYLIERHVGQVDCFEKVPASLLNFKDWRLVFGKAWRRSENILRTEARALEWAVRHKYRRHDCLRQRHVFLVDNLPLELACGKGRADSAHLKQVCKVVCAYQLATASFIAVFWIPV
jgi:hypothetical protein